MQRTLLNAVMLAGASVLLAGSAGAQGNGRRATGYPPGFRPPPGMCRVWINGVPPGRQPGVTDCATARASASANATVLYGDRNDDPSYRGRSGSYTRTVYDQYGNRVTQRVRRNADGSVSVLGSTPYPNGNGKMLPGTLNGRASDNDQVHGKRHDNDNRDYNENEHDKGNKDYKDNDHKEKKDHNDKKDHNGKDHDHR